MTATSPKQPTWPQVPARTPAEREALLEEVKKRVAEKAKPTA